MGGVAGPARSGVAGGDGRRIEGWSKVPFGARLPSIVLVAGLGLAAVVREAAPVVFLGMLFAYLYARRSGNRSLPLAAVLPAAAILVWRALPQPTADPLGADCANLLAPPALWRFMEAAVGLLALGALLWDRKASLGELGFRRGSPRVRAIADRGAAARRADRDLRRDALWRIPARVDVLRQLCARPVPALALAPALLFAASNALAEELAFRGAMRTWLTPSLGILGANLAQAVVFGLSHTGRDFVGIQGMIPVMLAMVVVAFVAGVIARRTKSLTIPLAIHAAADIPIYLYWACRAA